ncbi:MAG TPA: hypothetical protein VNE39_18460 [Planctomycetota bacterium]|nr:hypothetical protein [Planctomycetota bacterium]
MRAGSARVEITPPKGLPMGGFPERTDPSEGVHDPLFARALVLDDGAHRVAILSADLPEVSPAFAAEVRGRIQQELGIPAEHVLLATSHTHAGPLVMGRRVSAPDPLYLDTLRNRLVGVAREAGGALRPARAGAGRAKVYLGVNRRERAPDGRLGIGKNPARYASPYAHVLVVAEEGGGPLALLFTYGAHPAVLGPRNLQVSGDYAGHAERVVEENFGDTAVALFALGFAGDVDANHTKRNFDEVEQLGIALGRAVIEEMKSIELLGGLGLRARSLRVPLPLESLPSIEEAESRLLAERERLAGILGRSEDKSEVIRRRMRVDWASELVRVASEARGEQAAELEVQGIAIGRIAIVGLSGEPFAELEKGLQELSPFPHTIPIGGANGTIGYLPTDEAFAEGGYEVETAPYLYGALRLQPGIEPVLRQALARVLVDLAE